MMKNLLLSLLIGASVLSAVDMPVLNDRLILDLPEGAQYGQRVTAIMAANPGDDETLIWVGDGAERIAVYAQEIDVLADEDFEKQARGILEKCSKEEALYEIKTQEPHVIYALRTTAPSQPGGSDLYGVALIRHTDGSLIRLNILFAADHAKDAEKCRAWAEKAIRSVRIGSGIRNSAARKDLISLPFLKRDLEIPVPEGYVRTINPGPDFTFTTYRKLNKMDVPEEYFGVYIGLHPNFHEKEFKDAQKVKSSVAGKSTTWYCTEPTSDAYRAETLVSFSGGWFSSEPSVYSHLIISAPSAEKRAELIHQLSRSKLVDSAEKSAQ